MSYALQVRLTDDQADKLRKLAAMDGLSLSDFVRTTLLKLERKKKITIDL